jgi:hypothetical protein
VCESRRRQAPARVRATSSLAGRGRTSWGRKEADGRAALLREAGTREGPQVNLDRRSRMRSSRDPCGDVLKRALAMRWRCGQNEREGANDGRLGGGGEGISCGGRAEIFSGTRGDGSQDEFGRAQLRSSNRASQPCRAETLFLYEAGSTQMSKPV